MNRVLILGCCGAGKSTFARELSQRTQLPLIHLDQHYFTDHWVEPDKESWHSTVTSLSNQEQWIMDGNYGGTLDFRLQYADTVIFLNSSTLTCLYRVISRTFKYYGRARPDVAPGCRERFDLGFLHYVLLFNHLKRPSILRRISASNVAESTVILHNNRERADYLRSAGNLN